MRSVWAWIVGAITLMAVLAAFSRFVQMKESPKYIEDAAKALTKLFNGAFGY